MNHSPSPDSTRRRDERRLYDQLNRLFARLPLHLPPTVTDLRRCVTAEAGDVLRACPQWNPDYDLAWFLLHEAVQFGADRTSLANHLFWEIMPPLDAWFRYLESFPPGEVGTAYRRRRVTMAEIWLTLVHIPPEWLTARLPTSSPTDPAPAHVSGNHVCLLCQTERRARSSMPYPTARLAAAAPTDTVEIPMDLTVGDSVVPVILSIVTDADYTRLFLTPTPPRTLPEGTYRVVMTFATGTRTTQTLRHPADQALGKNLGKTTDHPPQGIVSVLIYQTQLSS
ncbi:MAG: hypothetical protein HUU55_07290 [Myxococcales bacterium]|nr:hypothetical protein [Myxococcales bacterium]